MRTEAVLHTICMTATGLKATEEACIDVGQIKNGKMYYWGQLQCSEMIVTMCLGSCISSCKKQVSTGQCKLIISSDFMQILWQ